MHRLLIATLIVVGCTSDIVNFTPRDMSMKIAADLSVVFPSDCSDGVKDDAETDVDCGGGTCMPCDTGAACVKGRDCASTFCTNAQCDAASCSDMVKNGTESDVDCGGSCPGCAVGKMCNGGTDCGGLTCTNGQCAASLCTNGRQDGMETDIDCGGGTCAPCDGGKMCLLGTDCKGMMCTNNVCHSPLDMARPPDLANTLRDCRSRLFGFDANPFPTLDLGAFGVNTGFHTGQVNFVNSGMDAFKLSTYEFDTNDSPSALSVAKINGFSFPGSFFAGAQASVSMQLDTRKAGSFSGVLVIFTDHGWAAECVTGDVK